MQGTVELYKGTYRYRFQVGSKANGTLKRQSKGGFATKREAQQALRKALAAYEDGYQLSDGTNVGGWLDSWLRTKLRLSPTTRRSYRGHIDRYLMPAIGKVELTQLRVEHLDRMYEDIRSREDRPSPATMERIHATLRAALNTALKRRLITYNPALQVELESPHRTRQSVWTPAELQRFLDLDTDDRWHPVYCLVAMTGLRREEVRRLEWPDVDLDDARLVVRHSKTEAGTDRIVPLDERTVARLRVLRRRHQEERLAIGGRKTERVASWEDGGHVSGEYLTRHFHDLSDLAELPRIRLHDLRHTHATHLLALGVPAKVVQERLGHASSVLTMDTYTQVLREVHTQAIDGLAALYGVSST